MGENAEVIRRVPGGFQGPSAVEGGHKQSHSCMHVNDDQLPKSLFLTFVGFERHG